MIYEERTSYVYVVLETHERNAQRPSLLPCVVYFIFLL